jgi:hypothetical protein
MRSKKEYVEERNKKFADEIKTYNWSFLTKCLIKYYELKTRRKFENLPIYALVEILNRCDKKDKKCMGMSGLTAIQLQELLIKHPELKDATILGSKDVLL